MFQLKNPLCDIRPCTSGSGSYTTSRSTSTSAYKIFQTAIQLAEMEIEHIQSDISNLQRTSLLSAIFKPNLLSKWWQDYCALKKLENKIEARQSWVRYYQYGTRLLQSHIKFQKAYDTWNERADEAYAKAHKQLYLNRYNHYVKRGNQYRRKANKLKEIYEDAKKYCRT